MFAMRKVPKIKIYLDDKEVDHSLHIYNCNECKRRTTEIIEDGRGMIHINMGKIHPYQKCPLCVDLPQHPHQKVLIERGSLFHG